MKKNEAATQYALLFLLAFSFLYIYFYFDIKGFLMVLMLLATLHLPSLFAIVLLYYLDAKKQWGISKLVFVLLAIGSFVPTFMVYKSTAGDPRNLFPIFEEPVFTIFLLCVVAHSIALICILMIEKLNLFLTKR
ncbi:MAG: hypothetical protein AAFZ89_16645 [Bacteroidota bacterium]